MKVISLLFMFAGIATVISMLLSVLWHQVDKRTESIWDQRRRLAELNIKTPHPSEAAEHAEEVEALEVDIARKHRLLVRTKWVRPIGVLLLYLSLVVFAVASIAAGVHYYR